MTRQAVRFVAAAAVLVALAAAAAGWSASHERPPENSAARTDHVIFTTWFGLVPGGDYAVTWKATFEDGDQYWLGGTWGRKPALTGILQMWTPVADLVYWYPGEPLEYVRVCLRPPGSPVDTEIPGPDGNPLCSNVEMYDFVYGGYGYGETAQETLLADAETLAVPAGEDVVATGRDAEKAAKRAAKAAARAAKLAAR